MEQGGIEGLASALGGARPGGPVALVIVEDVVEVDSTLRHHLGLGFSRVIAVAPPDLPAPGIEDARLTLLRAETRQDGGHARIVNTAIAAAPPGQWLYYCFNAEYLVFPFSEERDVAAFCAFVTEERRDAVACVTVDLYAPDPATDPGGVSRARAHLDRIGYFAHGRSDAQGHLLDRQQDLHGGLRWRFEEHVPPARRQIGRAALFRAARGLRLGADHRFDQEEYNTLQCPWHRSPTAATLSFRTAKALRRNPASREAIGGFGWPGAVPCDWSSRQLLDLGLIETGQWF